MAHFANPLHVTAMPSSCSVRISVRASETRVDEWSITAADVRSVLEWSSDEGWRGNGELRVLIERASGSVAFHSSSGDRAIIRGPESMVHSFLAHLQAAHDALPSAAPEAFSGGNHPVTYDTSASTAPATIPAATQEVLAAIQLQVAQSHAELLSTIHQLAAAVSTALSSAPAGPPVLQVTSLPTSSETVFIPSLLTSVEGSGLAADEKTSEAGDLTAATAALKAAKKNTRKEIRE